MNDTLPSRQNWMLQFHLRQQGLALSCVGTGSLTFSLDFGDADFEAVCHRFEAAAQALQRDGWWWHPPGVSNRGIRRDLPREMLRARF